MLNIMLNIIVVSAKKQNVPLGLNRFSRSFVVVISPLFGARPACPRRVRGTSIAESRSEGTVWRDISFYPIH